MQENEAQSKDDVTEVFQALISFQSEIYAIEKTAENPHLKTTYTSLESYLKATREILAKHSLAVMQRCFSEGEQFTLVTTLIHTSGQWISDGGVPIFYETRKGINLNQAMGGAISYARRYAYAAILGLTQSDDDGESAAPAQQPEGWGQPPAYPMNPAPQPQFERQPGYGGGAPDYGPPPGQPMQAPPPQQQMPAPTGETVVQQPQQPNEAVSPELSAWATEFRNQLLRAGTEAEVMQVWNNPQNQAKLGSLANASVTGSQYIDNTFSQSIARVRGAAPQA